MTLVTFATSIQGYRSSMAKATMVFDNELRSLTQVLANITDLHPVALATQKDAAFVYQIWQNNKLIINLGKAHGIEKGQRLNIAHHNYLTDAAGNKMPHLITTLNQIQVEQVYQQSAVAVSIDQQPLPNIQINDVVELTNLEP